MQRRLSNSPAPYLVGIAVGGLLVFSTLLAPSLSRSFAGAHSTLLRAALFFALLLAGFTVEMIARTVLQRHIRNGRWSADDLNKLHHRFFTLWWRIPQWALLGIAAIFLVSQPWPRRTAGYAFWFLAIFIGLLQSAIPPKEEPLPQIDPTRMTPLHSDHWGESSHPPLTS